jgi:urease accessory protein
MRFQEILGYAGDPEIADRLHGLSHRGWVEYVWIGRCDLGRRRFRVTTDQGTECAIALPRDLQLADGAVLFIGQDRAVVVRVGEQHWLRLRPLDEGAALELGYLAGSLHWRVHLDGKELKVALEGPESKYLESLSELFSSGRVRRVDDT